MARGIRKRDAQCEGYRAPGDGFQQPNGGQDVLEPVLEGVDLLVGLPRCAVCSVVVAIDGLDHPDEAVQVKGASNDGDTTGAGQANSSTAMAELIAAQELGRAKENDGCVRSKSGRVGQGFCPEVGSKGLDMPGSNLRWRGGARCQQGGRVGAAHILFRAKVSEELGKAGLCV